LRHYIYIGIGKHREITLELVDREQMKSK